MKNVGFIFARGGSKGLRRKNVLQFVDKPLIAHSIELAKRIDELFDVYVSTDDDEIAAVASKYGAKVIHRPPELATDTAPEWLAWQHAVRVVQHEIGDFEGFVSLPATSPLRSETDVLSAIEKRDQSGADCCIGITPASRSPYFNMVSQDANGIVKIACEPTVLVQRRQDAEPLFDITTVVYAATTSFVLQKENLFAGTIVAVTIPKERAVDIDDAIDFELAELIARRTISDVSGSL